MSLFGRKSDKPQQTGGRTPSARTQAAFEAEIPDAALMRARNEYFDSIGQPVIDKARFFVLSLVLGILAIILGAIVLYMLPLKTTEPYVIYVDKDRGLISKGLGEVTKAVEYTPERPVLERELYQFVERLYALNAEYSKVIRDGHNLAYAYTRGRAVEVFRAFMDTDQPYQRMKTTRGLVRNIERKTISFREDGKLVLIRFKTIERTEDRPVPVVRDWLMTLQFERKQPTEREEIERNPLGIYITHFETVEER